MMTILSFGVHYQGGSHEVPRWHVEQGGEHVEWTDLVAIEQQGDVYHRKYSNVYALTELIKQNKAKNNKRITNSNFKK